MEKTSKFRGFGQSAGKHLLDWLRKTKQYFTRRDERGNYMLFDSPGALLIWSMVLELILEILSRHSLADALLFLVTCPYAFLFSSLMIFFTLSLTLLTPVKMFLQTLLSVLWLTMGVTNCVLLFKRVTPFTVIDLTLITSVFRIFSVYLSVIEIVLIVLAILLALAGLVWLAIKAPKSKIDWKRAVATVIIAALLLTGGYPLGLSIGELSNQFPNLSVAYDRYGFPFCFMVGVFDRGISQPADYSQEQIQSILSAIGQDQEVANEGSPNVIYLQLESFFDVNYLTNVQFSENPIPYFTQLKSQGLSGFLTVPSVGAGTINTEFEVLTGMSIAYFGAGEYPYKTVLMNDTCETAAYNLKELGYATHAIHNYEGTFYDRNKVYRNLGFDTFTSLEYMQDVVYNDSGSWPKDQILVDEILTALKSTEERDFIMAVSVQGHGKYPPMSLPVDYQYPIEATFIDGKLEGGLSDIAGLSYYVSQLREMDNFLRMLVEALNNYPEEVMLVLYGDHLPSLSIVSTDLANENIFQTEYVILTNYGAELRYDDPGDLYAYQLGAIAMDVANIRRGVLTRYHQTLRDSEQYLEYLKDLEYDMLYGKRYVYGGNNERYLPVELVMGVRPIAITDTDYDPVSGVLTVHGTNFTQWSKLRIDGDLYSDTEYVSSTCLRIVLEDAVVEGLEIVQYSADGVVLSATPIYPIAIPVE